MFRSHVVPVKSNKNDKVFFIGVYFTSSGVECLILIIYLQLHLALRLPIIG